MTLGQKASPDMIICSVLCIKIPPYYYLKTPPRFTTLTAAQIGANKREKITSRFKVAEAQIAKLNKIISEEAMLLYYKKRKVISNQ